MHTLKRESKAVLLFKKWNSTDFGGTLHVSDQTHDCEERCKSRHQISTVSSKALSEAWSIDKIMNTMKRDDGVLLPRLAPSRPRFYFVSGGELFNDFFFLAAFWTVLTYVSAWKMIDIAWVGVILHLDSLSHSSFVFTSLVENWPVDLALNKWEKVLLYRAKPPTG